MDQFPQNKRKRAVSPPSPPHRRPLLLPPPRAPPRYPAILRPASPPTPPPRPKGRQPWSPRDRYNSPQTPPRRRYDSPQPPPRPPHRMQPQQRRASPPPAAPRFRNNGKQSTAADVNRSTRRYNHPSPPVDWTSSAFRHDGPPPNKVAKKLDIESHERRAMRISDQLRRSSGKEMCPNILDEDLTFLQDKKYNQLKEDVAQRCCTVQ